VDGNISCISLSFQPKCIHYIAELLCHGLRTEYIQSCRPFRKSLFKGNTVNNQRSLFAI